MFMAALQMGRKLAKVWVHILVLREGVKLARCKSG